MLKSEIELRNGFLEVSDGFGDVVAKSELVQFCSFHDTLPVLDHLNNAYGLYNLKTPIVQAVHGKGLGGGAHINVHWSDKLL